MEFPTIEEFGKKVAENALDEFLIDDISLREWIETLSRFRSCIYYEGELYTSDNPILKTEDKFGEYSFGGFWKSGKEIPDD